MYACPGVAEVAEAGLAGLGGTMLIGKILFSCADSPRVRTRKLGRITHPGALTLAHRRCRRAVDVAAVDAGNAAQDVPPSML